MLQTIEFSILDWIQAVFRCDFLDVVMPAISFTSNNGEIWILLAVILLLVRGKRCQGVMVAGGLLTDFVICNKLLKPLIGRLRPFAVDTAVELLIKAPHDASFPSGHTAISFAAVFALKAAGSPLWKPAAVYAVLIAFSRLYLYVHWPTDVAGGVLVGALCGWLGAKVVEKAYTAIKQRRN